jgi:hypothetical protein
VILSFLLLGMMLVFGLTATGVLAFFVAGEKSGALPQALDVRLLPYIGLLAVIKTVAAFGVWRWNRWGVYLLLVTAGVTLVADFSLPKPVLGSAFEAVIAIVVFFICRRKWDQFA